MRTAEQAAEIIRCLELFHILRSGKISRLDITAVFMDIVAVLINNLDPAVFPGIHRNSHITHFRYKSLRAISHYSKRRHL